LRQLNAPERLRAVDEGADGRRWKVKTEGAGVACRLMLFTHLLMVALIICHKT
jgi:hypothetical protein